MQWWTNFLDWLNSDSGWRIMSTAVIPFVAIVVAGFAAALIGRASARKVVELSEREVRASAVTALISTARKAAVWNTLSAPEQQHIDHLIGDAEIRLRLLPIAGTSLAADWARHEIAGMKRNAVSFSFQAEQSLLVFRDRLIEWQGRPGRAKKLFKNDLDSWAYESTVSEQELVHEQQKWAAQQVTETGPITTVTSTSLDRPAVPPAREAEPVGSAAVSTSPAVDVPTVAMPAVAAAPAVLPAAVAASAGFRPAEPFGTTTEEPLHPLVEPEDSSPRGVSEVLAFSENPFAESSDDTGRFEPWDEADEQAHEHGDSHEHRDSHGDQGGDHDSDTGAERDDENHGGEDDPRVNHESAHVHQHEEWRG